MGLSRGLGIRTLVLSQTLGGVVWGVLGRYLIRGESSSVLLTSLSFPSPCPVLELRGPREAQTHLPCARCCCFFVILSVSYSSVHSDL